MRIESLLICSIILLSSSLVSSQSTGRSSDAAKRAEYLKGIKSIQNSVFGVKKEEVMSKEFINEVPLYYKRENGTNHIVITYLSADTLITTNLYLYKEIYVSKGTNVFESPRSRIQFNFIVQDTRIMYYDKERGKEYTYNRVRDDYLNHRIPNIYVINRSNGERQGVIIRDHIFYDPFILRDTSKYVLSELALQLTFSSTRSFRDDESKYELSNGNTLNLKSCFLCLNKRALIDLDEMTLHESPLEKVDVYRFNFELPQIKGCMFGDCYNGYGVQRVLVEGMKCIIIEGNFVNGYLEGEGMVSTVINIGRGYFSSKLIVEHKRGLPNGEGVEYLCGLQYELIDEHALYRKGIWKDGAFVSGIDNSDPDDKAYHYKSFRDYMNAFLSESSTINNTISNSDYRIMKGSDLLRVQKSSTELMKSVVIDVSDGGFISSNVCEGSYLVTYTDQFGNVTNTNSSTDDSSEDVGCNGYSFPIVCRVVYKNECSDTEYKNLMVKFYKPGIYNVQLETW